LASTRSSTTERKTRRALLALLLACGLRRHEAVALRLDHLQQREEHWAIVDLIGKGGHVRTVPVPIGENRTDDWITAAAIDRGKLFRRVNKVGRTWGDGMTVKAVWHIVKNPPEHRRGEVGAARSATLCRIPDYAESSMKHLHLALSWRTETISRFGIAGRNYRPSGRPTGHRQAIATSLFA